ncbi:MAG: hypothetical protein HY722_02070 [Planctomycetes bacterium]|nr:hypothetical protein [Planctomycetota bacterium]
MAWYDERPPGYAVAIRGETVAILRERYRGALVEAGIHSPQAFVAAAGGPSRRYRGRGHPVAVPVPGHPGEHMVLRHYRRGGLVGKLLGDLYLGPRRPLNEIRVAEHCIERGVPTTTPIGAVVRRVLPGFYRCDLMTREVPGALDLAAYLATAPPPGERRRALKSAGAAVRAMHDAGVIHPDLNMKNILILGAGTGATSAVVIDLDRAWTAERVAPPRANANLARLARSAAKNEALGGAAARTSRGDTLCFLRAYHRGSREGIRATARYWEAYGWRLVLHRLFWGAG